MQNPQPVPIDLWGRQPPAPAHRQVLSDPHRFIVLVAGRKFRKSSVTVAKLFKGAMTTPLVYPFIAPFRNQAKNIVWDDHVPRILEELKRAGFPYKKNDSTLTIKFPGGGQFKVDGSDNAEALRGIGNWGGLGLSEYSDWKADVWTPIIRPNLMTTRAWTIFEGTPKGFNHFHVLAKKGDHNGIIEGDLYDEQGQILLPEQYLDPDYQTYRFTSYDNPYLDVAEIEAAKRDSTPEWFEQEYLARFTKYTGLVYKEFDRAVHMQEIADFQPVYYLRGLDRGFTNPTAVPIIQVNSDGDWYQTHELYQAGLTNPPLAGALKSLSDEAGVGEYELSTMDSAQASDIMELANLGEDFVPVRKESGEKDQSYIRWKIQKFAQRLRVRENKRPRYFVHPRCINTIREFETYRWPEKKPNQNDPENPLKLNDHMMDALADLNGMYEHLYNERDIKPWDNKLPNTYVEPSPGSDREESDNNWGGTVVYEHEV